MKKNLVIISLIFILPILAYFMLSQGSTTAATKSDNKDTKGLPVIMKFSSTMCIDCKRLTEVIKEVYPKYEDKVVLESIMVESNDPKIIKKIKKHKVVLVPTLIFVDADGKIVKQTEGYMDEATFEKYVKELINGTLH